MDDETERLAFDYQELRSGRRPTDEDFARWRAELAERQAALRWAARMAAWAEGAGERAARLQIEAERMRAGGNAIGSIERMNKSQAFARLARCHQAEEKVLDDRTHPEVYQYVQQIANEARKRGDLVPFSGRQGGGINNPGGAA